MLFQLQLEQRKFPQAIATLKEAETFCPQSIDNRIEIRFDYAMIYCFQADVWPDQSTHYYDMALEVLTELSKETALPLDVKCEIEVTQAEIFMKTNREQQAVVIAERVAHMDEEDLIEYVERCRFMLLQYYSGKKDYSKVQEYAVLLKDSETVFHRHMGYYAEANALSQLASKDTSLQKKAQRAYEVAIAYYKNCTVSSPGDYLAYLYRAMAYVDIGKYDRAQEILRVLPEDGRKKLQAHIDQKRNGGSRS